MRVASELTTEFLNNNVNQDLLCYDMESQWKNISKEWKICVMKHNFFIELIHWKKVGWK